MSASDISLPFRSKSAYIYNINSEKILAALREKAAHVPWFNNSRIEYFAIFAKSFSKRSKDCLCFDLNDVEKMLK
ncbi:MAG: hypothetical protein HXS48_13825 [Theionarchaea archaeon]|nr:MAG: hypothetical protein AYK19_11335 [Theionarchaea archaeon DG-70-1]MBU7028009.1 hypothetical protein [Theionarchaea archaeon]